MTEPDPETPGRRPRAFQLADPTAAPDPDWTPGRAEQLVRRLARAARPWMALPAAAAVLAIAAVVPVSATIEHPGDLLMAADHVTVEGARDPGISGTYLLPRRNASPSALDWMLAVVLPDRALVATEPTAVNGFDPIESALLIGKGVAPGRGSAINLGVAAIVRDPGITAASLGLSVAIFDQLSSVDLAGGRRILVLGGLDANGRVSCAADPLAALTAADPPVDVVVLGEDCEPAQALGAVGAGPRVLAVPSLPDALGELSG